MTNGGYEAFDDPYCYKGTDVLKNRLGTRDPVILEAFELEMTTLRAEEPLPNGRFGAAHYRAIHRHMFQDVYAWAGQYRTVRTGKGGKWFCYPEHIPQQMAARGDSDVRVVLEEGGSGSDIGGFDDQKAGDLVACIGDAGSGDAPARTAASRSRVTSSSGNLSRSLPVCSPASAWPRLHTRCSRMPGSSDLRRARPLRPT
ncbi:MAG: Fic/DOC family protein [Hyphomicrobiaceae bacterium]